MKRNLLSFLLIIFSTQLLLAKNNPIIINTPTEKISYTCNQLQLYKDETLQLNIQDILNSSSSLEFVTMTKKNENCGFSDAAYWIQTQIINNSCKEQTFLLSIDYPLLNDIRFYEIQHNKIIDSTYTGENYAHNTRQYNDRFFIFKLHLLPNTSKTYFIRVCNIGETTRLPIKIEREKELTGKNQNEIFGNSIYYGYFLFALIFSLLMFFEFKKRLFFYNTMYIFSMALFLFIVDGFAFQYLWPNLSYISNHSIILFAILSALFLICFSNQFLESTRKIIVISRIFQALCIITFFWNIIPNPLASYSFFAVNIIIFITVLFILVIALIKYYYNRTHYNLLFVLSILLVNTSVIIYILRNYGVLEISYLTNNGVKIGFAAQITLLTAATIIQFRELFKKSNKFLEDIVQKRTLLISSQNEQLRNQNKRIALQYKEIKQSMTYAKRLQTAILPNKYKFSSIFKDHLIFYKPKDIVSGDFYWITDKNNKTYIVTADCTGHGIPGGFLSMLGISFLNQIVSKNTAIKPNEILNKLGILFSETLNDHDNVITRDSMDISICLINHLTNEMEYAGAYNPIYLVRNAELFELTVDKISLRKDFTSENITFTNKKFILQENDKIYLFTDGYADQFGGDFNKRFTKRQFKHTLTKMSSLTMSEQKQELENTFNTWKGKHEQVDDILIIGIDI